MSGHRRSRQAARSSIAALAFACAVWAPPAAAMSSRGDGNLSLRLAELAKPAVRTLPPAKQAERLSLAPSGPASLLREGNRVLVDVRFNHGAAAGVNALRAAGAQIAHVSRRYQTVTVAAKPADLHDIAGVPRVDGVTENLAPIVAATCPSGVTVSEGDGQLRAAEARSDFGLDGSGVTVGILSDSFDQDATAATHAAGDVTTGDLPGSGNPCGHSAPVNVLDDSEPQGADEGRGMAQIVHDLAPGASIDFATAFTPDMFGFANNIRRLANAGAQVIADDVFYPEEPFFQDGPVAVAVNDVTAEGAAYFSAVGNDNLIEKGTGNEIASWEAPEYRDDPVLSCPAAIVALSEELEEKEGLEPQGLHPSHCMDFDPEEGAGHTDETFGITVPEGGVLSVDLQWAEPWFGVETDLDAFLLDEGGKLAEGESFPVVSAGDNVNVSQEPTEFFQWENPGPEQKVQLVINRFSGVSPRLKLALLENGFGVIGAEYPKSKGGDVVGPTVFGHSGAASAVGVGAVPYDNSQEPEEYSSRGPVTHYFDPVTGIKPAAKLTSPQTISKPDVAATDCGVTTFFAQFKEGVWRFCGTSAAAPHAAAVAALMLQSNPSLSPAQVRAGLTGTAVPVGSFGSNAVGAGLVNAYGAVESVALPPKVTITRPPPAIDRERRPAIEFTANRPVTFSCSLDGAALEPCSSPFIPPVDLVDGGHSFEVTGTDIAGRVGTSGPIHFTIDTRRPNTFFAKHPRRVLRTRHRKVRATFRFGSNESGATFICKVDRGLLHFCGAKFSRRFHAGKHFVLVKARDAAGNVDRTPAVFHFKVKRVG
jgi:subtilisin family serine protease